MKAFYKRWGNEGEVGTGFTELPTRRCTYEELGIGSEDGGTQFWRMYGTNMQSLESYKDRMICIDDDITVRGAYNSERAQQLSIQFVACNYSDPNAGCKTHEEIKDFMRRKFIMTLDNYSMFNLDQYGDSKVTKEARITWHPMNSVLR